MVVVGGRIFYMGWNGTLYGLDGNSGRLSWKHDFAGRATTKLSASGSSLYLGNSSNRLFRISVDSGDIQNELSIPASPEGRILTDASALYLFLEDHDTHVGYLMRTDRNLSKIVWIHKAERAWSSEWPRLWNGLLLAGNCKGELDAFRPSDGKLQWSNNLNGCLRSIGMDGQSGEIYVGAQEGTLYAFLAPN